jgi:hypothetical protein
MTTPGTVYRARLAADPSFASTVTVLQNGQLLELRRGEKTQWWCDEWRGRWASLEDWKADLPAGATVQEGQTVKEPDPSFHPLFKDPCIRTIRTNLLFRKSDYDRKHKVITERRKSIYRWLVENPSRGYCISKYNKYMDSLEKCLSTASRKPIPYIREQHSTSLYCEDAHGVLWHIGLDHENGRLARKTDTSLLIGPSLEAIGLPSAPRMWLKKGRQGPLIPFVPSTMKY